MAKSNLWKEFVWADGSRGIRVHHGREARPQASMAIRAGSWEITSSVPSTKEREKMEVE